MEAAGARWDVFLCCDEADEAAAATLYEGLVNRGRRAFLAKKSLQLGEDRELEAQRAQLAARVTVVLHSQRTRPGFSRRAEVARALNEAQAHLIEDRDGAERREQHRVVPLWLDGQPDVSDSSWGLLLKVGLDLRELPGGLADAAKALDDLLGSLGGEAAPATVIERPFRPLAPFLPGDRDLFFGRDLFVRDLRALVDGAPLCVLHGASGTGKTSLLQAGLQPLYAGGDLWLQLSPRGGLLGQVFAAARPELARHGRPLPETPALALREVARLSGRRVLLVIDQAEEMFLGKNDEACEREARETAKVLQAAAPGEVHILLSIRDDYFGHLHYLRKAGVPGIFQDELLLRPLDETGGRLAIEEPLRRAGCGLAVGLARRMLSELEEGGQVSPVELELVCQKLFERARAAGRSEIGDDLYDGMGGAGKVIGTYLAEALAELPAEERGRASAVLRQLVGIDGTRQGALVLEEVAYRADLPEAEAREALERLVPLRLVRSEDQEGAVYRIAHDRLAKAVYEQMGDSERRDLVTREVLRRRAAAWQESGRPRPWRLDIGLRRELLDWRTRNPAVPLEDAYLGDVAAADRWLRRAARWGPVLAAALVLGLAGLLYASYQRGRELQAQAAEIKAEAALEKDPSQAMAWIAEAARLRGGILREPERSYHEHWLMAREAWDRGLGWVVAEQRQQIWKLAFNPAGEESCAGCWPRRRLLAYASGEGTVGLMDLDRGGVAQALHGAHKTAASDVAFSPDGRWLASCGYDGTARIWEVAGGRQVHVFERMRTEFTKARFSPDGRHLALGSTSGPIYLLTTDSWQARELPGHDRHAMALAFSPDSAWLASASLDGQARLAGVTGGETRELPTGLSSAQDLAFSRDGERLLLAGKEGIRVFHWPFQGAAPDERISMPALSLDLSPAGVLVWGDMGGKVWQQWPDQPQVLIASHLGPVFHVEFSPSGEWFLSSGDDGLVLLTHHKGGWQRTLSGHAGRVNTAAFSSDGLLAASGDGTGRVRLWPVQRGRTQLLSAGSQVRAVTARDPGQWVAAGLEDGRVALWSGQEVSASSPGQPGPQIRSVCWLSGDQVLTAGLDGWLRRWRTSDGSMEEALMTQEPATSLLCPPAVEATLFSGHAQSILAWSGEASALIGKHSRIVTALALGADRRTLFSASLDGTVRAWDVQLRKEVRPALDAKEELAALALGAEDEVFFGGRGARVHRLDPRTGVRSDMAPPLGGSIMGLATTGDRALLASASDDQLRLWWPRSGASRSLRGHIGVVSSVHFPPDGQTLLSGGGDATVRVWPLPPRDRAAFQRWLEAHSPFEIRGGQPVPRPLPRITEDFTGPPPPPPKLRPDCVAGCGQAAKDGSFRAGKTLKDCLATCR